jgi:hypothetical protein
MYRRTGGFFGINEALLASTLAASVFSLFDCQPLTIVGVTGLIALFNYTIYDIIVQYDPMLYLRSQHGSASGQPSSTGSFLSATSATIRRMLPTSPVDIRHVCWHYLLWYVYPQENELESR